MIMQARPRTPRRPDAAFPHHRLLTADEEIELARRIREGDAAARHELAEKNLALTWNIAGEFLPFPRWDGFGWGCVGLMRAVDGFDPARRCRFSTYASNWIRQSIRRAIQDTARPIRIPGYMVDAVRRTPPPSDPPGTRKEETLAMARAVLDAGWADRGALGQVADRGPSGTVPPEMTAAEARVEAHRLLSALDDRSRAVVCRRYGIGGGEPAKLAEVGEDWGICRERVRQLIEESLCTMRDVAGADHAG